ncbi:addiction module toxin, HicA family protein [Capnocytophaga cynodegmi]|uniref:type II toxin-antitoxin system HicA family toxin n=1 Tax=Capnocytophaga cynodegmi TaxID=28189 RepID=UPI001AC3E37F|nr:type II toxin-antitoxin system HicA family toxin [Capnocytophaga cynodegmi]GIM52049.1 addiction module toxin, HicA family protein [Capnocytophaga cynodegmi]
MKVSEMLRLLKEDGWFLYREGKKHSLYKHETKTDTVILPRHPATELKKGTEQSILKQAGLK